MGVYAVILGQLPLPAPGLPLAYPHLHLCVLKLDMIILWTNSRDVKVMAYLNPELSNSKSYSISTKLSYYFRKIKCPILHIKPEYLLKSSSKIMKHITFMEEGCQS